jgi:hypothetical protein
MTLLRERGRSDDDDARAFLLSNTAEERAELLRILTNRFELRHDLSDKPFTHRAVIRVYDEAGNVIETHEEGHRFRVKNLFPGGELSN